MQVKFCSFLAFFRFSGLLFNLRDVAFNLLLTSLLIDRLGGQLENTSNTSPTVDHPPSHSADELSSPPFLLGVRRLSDAVGFLFAALSLAFCVARILTLMLRFLAHFRPFL